MKTKLIALSKRPTDNGFSYTFKLLHGDIILPLYAWRRGATWQFMSGENVFGGELNLELPFLIEEEVSKKDELLPIGKKREKRSYGKNDNATEENIVVTGAMSDTASELTNLA